MPTTIQSPQGARSVSSKVPPFGEVATKPITSRLVRKSMAGITLCLALGMAWPALADDPAQVRRTMEQAIEVRQQTQKQADEWAGRKQDLQARHQYLLEEKERLLAAGALAKERRDLEARLVSETRRSIEGATEFENNLMPYLENTVTRLEEAIARDLPFLPLERSQRLAALREILVRPDATAADKLRRVMEALQIEADYGRSVEVYQDTVTVDGVPLLVDMLRLGRVSLFWRTPDGRLAGHFDPVTRQFAPLPQDNVDQVTKAMEVARRERTAELLELPIGRIEPQ